MFTKQQQNFGQRWHLGANSSCSENEPKPFLWGQPPDFGFNDKFRNNLVEFGVSSEVNNLPNEGLNAQGYGQFSSEFVRPPWEDSSEEEEKERKSKHWEMESGWEDMQKQVGSSPVSPTPNSDVTNFATTSTECDQSKDRDRRTQQPFLSRRRRYANTFEKIVFRSANSGLTILLPKDHPDLASAYRIASEAYSHGYSADNASKALDRFVKRNLLCVERMQCLAKEDRSAWNSTVHICRKFITVNSIGVENTKFEGHGATVKEAVANCDLAILYELFDFDVIKEANVEINNAQRKNLLDTARKLDLKTQAWLDCSTEKFAKKLKEISGCKELFY